MESTDISWEQLHSHPPEEVLERYGMRRLPEAECEQVEQHILFCKPCLTLLEESGHWVSLMKAAALPEGGLRKPAPIWKHWMEAVSGSLAGFPRPALAGGFAALLVVLITPAVLPTRPPPRVAQTSTVKLTAIRGNVLDVTVKAGVSFEIEVDDSGGLPGTITVVNADGKKIWNGPLQGNRAKIPALAPGSYWVRLFSVQSGEQTKEYGLSAQ